MTTTDRLLYGLLTCLLGGFAWICSATFLESTPTGVTIKEQRKDVDLISESPTYDFGLIPSDREVIHQFTVKNTTSLDYEIIQVVSSCGCMTPRTQLQGQVIESGNELAIPVLVDAAGKSGDFVGRIQVMFRATSADGQDIFADSSADDIRKTLVFSLQGEVRPILSARPSSVNIAQLIESGGVVIQVQRMDRRAFEQVKIQTPGDLVSATIIENTGSELKIQVRANESAMTPNPTIANGGISVHIPEIIGNNGYIYIPVQGLLTNGLLRASPQRVVLNRNRRGQVIRITGSRSDSEVSVELSESIGELISVTRANDTDQGINYTIDFLSTPVTDERREIVQGSITFSSDGEELALPVIVSYH